MVLILKKSVIQVESAPTIKFIIISKPFASGGKNSQPGGKFAAGKKICKLYSSLSLWDIYILQYMFQEEVWLSCSS